MEGKGVKTNRLFCRVYSVHTEWEIIAKKKKSFYTLALWCVLSLGQHCGILGFLAVGFAPSSWPQTRAFGREEPSGGTGPRLDDKRPLQGHRGPYFPAINKIAGGIYLDSAQGNTISEPKCTVAKPPPSLPLAYFSLGKSRIILLDFRTQTQNWPLPPPPTPVNWDASR